MAKPKADTSAEQTATTHDDARVTERLRRHLAYLGLTYTNQHVDEHLAWATRERPGATVLLEHVLAAEVDAKSEQRLAGRIHTSGLVERKTLEGFDWNFHHRSTRRSSSSSRDWTSFAAATTW